jgi:hypothetical protein
MAPAGESKGNLAAHILLRTVVLFAVGVSMNWYTNHFFSAWRVAMLVP